MHQYGLAWIALSLTLPNLIATTPARADDATLASPAEVATPTSDEPVKKVVPHPSAAASNCPLAPAPVYIEDWARLAALTESDSVVFPKAEFWAKRREQANWVLGTGLILGGGAAVLGTVDRLSTGAWSNSSKWTMAGGFGVAVVSLLLNWAFAPDRDDLVTVINHWNLRHPDRQLAP
jgi:hypothetical protein